MSDWAASERDGHADDATPTDGPASSNRADLIKLLQDALISPPTGLVLIELGFDPSDSPLSAEDVELVATEVADRIAGQAEPGDATLRTGRQSWALIRATTSAPAEAEGLAYRVHKALTEPKIIGDRQLSNRVAIGVVTSLAADTGEELLRYAEHALGDANLLGGDKVVVFDDEDRALLLP